MNIPGNTVASLHQIAARARSQEAETSQAARNAAREFEAVFLTQMVDDMLKLVEIGDFGGGHAEETWRGFLARAYADELAEQNSTGIARSVSTTIAAYESGAKTQESKE